MENNNRSAEIFDFLSKANFLSSNTSNVHKKGMYKYIEEKYESLKDLYLQVGYNLEEGNNYYYFSKANDTGQNIEQKIEKALRWLDLQAFFITFKSNFVRGERFGSSEIVNQIDLNMSLKEQLLMLFEKKTKDLKNYKSMVDDLLKELSKEGFIELENEMNQTWKILDAWDYLEQMVSAVNLIDEEEINKEQSKQIDYDISE